MVAEPNQPKGGAEKACQVNVRARGHSQQPKAAKTRRGWQGIRGHGVAMAAAQQPSWEGNKSQQGHGRQVKAGTVHRQGWAGGGASWVMPAGQLRQWAGTGTMGWGKGHWGNAGGGGAGNTGMSRGMGRGVPV